MEKNYSYIKDISFLNSHARTKEEFLKLFNENLFSDSSMWDSFELTSEINGLIDNIASRMKYSMSTMSLGIYNVMDDGPHQNIIKEDEIFLFTGFSEIETINKIGNHIMENNFMINPALFPNSVFHVPLSYYTILKKVSNYTVAVIDAMNTNLAFINFIMDRVKVNPNFIIATGEEPSEFFSNDLNVTQKIVPSFAAYKIETMQDRGFRFTGVFKNLEDLTESDCFKNAENVFCDKKTFGIFNEESNIIHNKKIFSEYPINKDNPCGIIIRLAMPFYFDIKGRSIVIENIKDSYYAFDISL